MENTHTITKHRVQIAAYFESYKRTAKITTASFRVIECPDMILEISKIKENGTT